MSDELITLNIQTTSYREITVSRAELEAAIGENASYPASDLVDDNLNTYDEVSGAIDEAVFAHVPFLRMHDNAEQHNTTSEVIAMWPAGSR